MSGDKVKSNPLKAELRVDVDARLAAMTDADRERQSKVILSKGSGCGPLCYLMHVNSLCGVLRHCSAHMFADDLCTLRAGTDLEQTCRLVQEDVDAVVKWSHDNGIVLNADKTNLPTEVPTEPILNDILARGDAVFVPQYSRGQMRMLRVLPGDLDLMVETSWKIKQHKKDADREDPMENGGLDLVIVPGAAFTRDGWRCGHGGGYYDRYLTSLRARHQADPAFNNPYIIAVGFNQQIYPSIPVDIQDVQVNEVLTAD